MNMQHFHGTLTRNFTFVPLHEKNHLVDSHGSHSITEPAHLQNLAWVVRKVDDSIHRINHYPVDKC